MAKKGRLLTLQGKTKDLLDWSKELNIPLNVLANRYYWKEKKGHSDEWVVTDNMKNRQYQNQKKSDPERYRATRLVSNYNCKDKRAGRGSGDLTVDWVVNKLRNAKCVYCEDDLDLGLDRINNFKPHEKDNVVVCCYSCNIARSDNFTHEEMMLIGKTIKKIKQNRLKFTKDELFG